MNTNLWLKQISAVLRLEIRKSFFSKRGLWIYLLALLPFLIFFGHAVQAKYDGVRAARLKTEGTTADKLRRVKQGMVVGELRALLPNPGEYTQWENRGGSHERFVYSDGQRVLVVQATDSVVEWVRHRGSVCDRTEDTVMFAGIFQFMYLRLFVFFGCMFVFMNLFRGEMLDKSLHFYFLAPMRREVLTLGKYLAGLVATTIIFGLSTIGQLAFLYSHWQPEQRSEYWAGNMLHDSLAYVGISALACLGYGALFLAAGMIIRNPLIPGAVVLLWESINGILPSSLRHVSIIYYLKSLCPVDVPMSQNAPPPLVLLASNVDPAGVAVAIGGLIVVSAAVVGLSMLRVKRMEINYGTD